jgi:membrane glycosyltransferase
MNVEDGRRISISPPGEAAPGPARAKGDLPDSWTGRDASARLPNADEGSHPRLPSPTPGGGQPQLLSMPEIRRATMVPSRIDRRPLARVWRRMRGRAVQNDAQEPDHPNASWGAAAGGCDLNAGWRRVAHRRRMGLTLLVLTQAALATWALARTFPGPELNASEAAILGIFAVLSFWISCGFWTAVAGFWVLWKRTSRFSLAAVEVHTSEDRPLRPRVAILMPICNEEAGRVFAGVEATYRSLAATGRLEEFHFYVLSDTRDPEKQIEEEFAWSELCRAVDASGRIFYRHRRNNIKRKSGNIADFLRRWGRNYDYMVVFDADSVMAGGTLVRLVSLMDRQPAAGIIQTVPTMVNRQTLFARVHQFASRAYGPILAAGLHFWQLGESYYWGHNAILRIEPFMRHCGLSRLPGTPPLGGEILSHDFVEAALMGRSGGEVWIAYGLGGSYEESPPTLLDELKRDRRWCQGNLQHFRLLFGDGIRAGHRAIMATGIMAYLSALLWAVFLILSIWMVVEQSLVPRVYFPSTRSLFPLWPRWQTGWAIALASVTAVLLLCPKFLGVLLIVRDGEPSAFGSRGRLWASFVLEVLFSTLLAPIRMWFHSKFVLLTLLGREIPWGAQSRDDNRTSWTHAIRQHGPSTALALAGLLGAFALNLSSLWWLLPVAVALILSLPLSVYSSLVSLGRAFRRWRLFMVPEEVEPPEIIVRLHGALERRQSGGEKRCVLGRIDPQALKVHVALLRSRNRNTAAARSRNRRLLEKALEQGPAGLTRTERSRLLRDPESMTILQFDRAANDSAP